MLKQFLPNEHVNSVFDIHPNELKKRGIKGIITDLDNTLVSWDTPGATPELIKWFKDMEECGIKITIVSNNSELRVKAFADPITTPYIFRARKPMTHSFTRAIHAMNLRNDEVVVVGDQLLTDILGGNRLGIYTILVVPVAKSDGIATRFNRLIERFILTKMRRRGWITWEEK
ncbi:YqeG family HAD IIIA-type phosphatase [Terrilactibacillus sp. BCM23-1]|uniref:YqeG family HAD IIIA-type phosphatase n=1 Tax=Terrilactibacillus tamarindi TaxID=2599694 RepID=A0A6N8CQQ6_9BACI|nr:YqeG family HAD IIIA-type phosphatase [Terrilactibacillus tamarindi]MTT32482.1 YqeG family HAD IIIA-type phosphatase [Terrilactibacillus tamarindi]